MFLNVGNSLLLDLGTCSYKWQHVPTKRDLYTLYITSRPPRGF